MSREEASTFLTLVFSLLIFLFISEIQARKLQPVCSASCGYIKNISYPFRLMGDPAGCGDRDYELSCESNKTILELNSGRYYVKGISYDDHMITVVDVNLANGSCGLPFNSLSAHDLMTYDDNRYRGDRLGTKYTNACFLRCSRNISNPAYPRVPCLGGNKSDVYVNYGAQRIADLPASCSFISMVPVLYRNVKYPSYESIRNLLDSGFELRWSVECRNCFVAGGSCAIYPVGTRIDFYCDKTNNSLSKNPLLILEQIFQLLKSLLEVSLSELQLFFQELMSRSPIESYMWESTGKYRLFLVESMVQLLVTEFVLVLLFSRFILAAIVLFVYIIHKYRTTWKTVDNIEKFLHNQQSWMPKRYSYSEIMAMTNHFTDKLGQGGFGSVYRGQLYAGFLIAVKVLENSKFSAEEFINEVSTIGRIHHVNVVRLLGFCSEGSKRALVYDYMPNGSLDKYLFSKEGKGQSFSWEKLYEIAFGIARGIKYLHVGCDVCILHFDIKPHNILLDHHFIPKVADFGLAKFYPKENDFVSISATRGTIGYIAPELISRNFGVISYKSDVYSFGMLLLEMAGGRRNSDMRASRSSKAYFPSWVYEQLNSGGDLELQNVNEIEALIAKKLCIIGLWCIQVKAEDRPSMTEVMEMLEGSPDNLPMPPKPFFSASQHISIREIQSDSSTEFLASELMEECWYNGSYI